MKNELMEATYGVEIKGAALQFLEGIGKTIDNIINLLNPFAWVGTVFSGASAMAEQAAMDVDLRQILELGKVGDGNLQALYQLTTRGIDLNVTPSLVELMGGTSLFKVANAASQIISGLPFLSNSPTGDFIMALESASTALVGAISDNLNSSRDYSVDSRYSWGTVGKSTGAVLNVLTGPTGEYITSGGGTAQSASEQAQSSVNKNLETMLSEDYIRGIVEDHGTYQDWVQSGEKYGITDMSKALSEAGYSEEDVKASFQSMQVQQGAAIESAKREREDTYWDNTEAYQLAIQDNTTVLIDLMTYNNQTLDMIYAKHKEFYDAWVDYFVNHTVYNEAFGEAANSVNTIRSQEKDKSDSAVYALAEALNKNSVDLLKDPVLQTNAILAQILIVVNAIMQQNNQTGGVMSLPDTLQALSMGLTGGTGTVSNL